MKHEQLSQKLQSSLISNKLQAEVLEAFETLQKDYQQMKELADYRLEVLTEAYNMLKEIRGPD